MELKRLSLVHYLKKIIGFTRTFMELKLMRKRMDASSADVVLLVPLWNWNFPCESHDDTRGIVLLVPLWNWNTRESTLYGKEYWFYSYLYGIETIYRSSSVLAIRVLLVPLWNWNFLHFSISPDASKCFTRTFMELKLRRSTFWCKEINVLLVPLWNWNWYKVEKFWYAFSFTRTFMELKRNNRRIFVVFKRFYSYLYGIETFGLHRH